MLKRKFHIFFYANILIWFIFFIIIFPTLHIVYNYKTILLEWSIISISQSPITFTIIADPLGIIFAITVLFISANVLRFSNIYISEEKYQDRFTILVLLFILSINLLIFMPHFIILLLGWDGLGITSFVLVIYYQNSKSLGAGIITALTNRVGDVILLLAIAWTLNQGHWLIINIWESSILKYQVIAIIIAAITKSAQIPFSRWLPAAIAAPTPVSALVHSSTLVTAGVFLIIRFYNFLHTLPYFNSIILFVAVSTIFIAGLRATTECDMKKIIALSTLRQLGIIITRLGLNAPNLAYFHIVTHALFKALLFICAGAFINEHLHTQDLRWIGNLLFQIPTASACITLANLALCGFPFIAGFYSKDLIIETSININHNLFIIIVAFFSLGLTSFYSTRFRLVVLWGPNLANSFINIKEQIKVILPTILLGILSILAGSAVRWITFLTNSIFILPSVIKLLPLIIISLGLAAAWFINTNWSIDKSKRINYIINHYASCLIWNLVPLSTQFIIKAPLFTSHHFIKTIDQGWFELSSGQGSFLYSNLSSNSLLSITPNQPILYLTISAIILITILSTLIIYST
jgi:NADH-ubiquinone oxidoreductase chain 5